MRCTRALLNGNDTNREDAAVVFGEDLTRTIWQAMPPLRKGWKVLPVVGRRADTATVIGEAFETNTQLQIPSRKKWNDVHVLRALEKSASKYPSTYGGLLVLIDEMGKLLESASQEGSDIYLLQGNS